MYNIYAKYGIEEGKRKALIDAILKKFRRLSRADGCLAFNKKDLLFVSSAFASEVSEKEQLEEILVRTTVSQIESEKSVDEYNLKKFIGNLRMVMIEGDSGFVITMGFLEVDIYIIFYFARPVMRGTEFGILFKRLNDLEKDLGEDLLSYFRSIR